MSKFSGKCDLADHVAGCGGWFDRDGKPTTIGSGVGVLYSDEMLDFIAFKKKTDGKLYQHVRIKVDEFNQNLVAENNPNFQIIKHTEIVKDARRKTGTREKVSCSYTYFGKTYETLKSLNQHEVYITTTIKFETLLDLIPYYPYIVASMFSRNGKEIVYISDESYAESEYREMLEHGYDSQMIHRYRKRLQRHYAEVVLRYFNPTGKVVEEVVNFDTNLKGRTSQPIDSNFEVKWLFDGSHWSSPKIIDEHTLEISSEDYDHYIGHSVKVQYVKLTERKLYLG